MAMPKDFEIEQMMMKGSTHRAPEFTSEDKSLVSKMISGSVTTLDANLTEKMIDGSVETNNARIVEHMVAGSQRYDDKKGSDDKDHDKGTSMLTQLQRTLSSGAMSKK